jgi:hypothetical protein
MTNNPRDRNATGEFEKELEEVRSAWSGLEPAEPPELLDQAVLNRARRELDTGTARRPLRWLGAFATAAVVVLALTIVIQQDRPLYAPVSESEEVLRLDPDTSAAKKEAPAGSVEEKAARKRAVEPVERESDERQEFRMQQSAPPAPAKAGLMNANAPQAKADEPEAQAADSVAAEITISRSLQKDAAPAPVPELMEDAVTIPESDFSVPGPEEWIKRLMRLRETRQNEKLVLELAAFREAYPDYPLPPELLD